MAPGSAKGGRPWRNLLRDLRLGRNDGDWLPAPGGRDGDLDRGGLGRRPARGILAEVRVDLGAVALGIDLATAIVLGARDEPELLGRTGLVKQGAGNRGADVGIAGAVDHQPGAG